MRVIESPHFKPVLATIQHNRLDPAQCIIHGGAALASEDLREPGDLDVLLAPSYYSKLAMLGQTFAGTALSETPTIKGRARMISREETSDGLLPLDLSTFVGIWRGVRFAHHRKVAEQVDSPYGILHIVSMAQLISQKSRFECAKDQTDVSLINAHLDSLVATAPS
jgi:hypothetical protein